jgi:hypothetical protein
MSTFRYISKMHSPSEREEEIRKEKREGKERRERKRKEKKEGKEERGKKNMRTLRYYFHTLYGIFSMRLNL